MKKKKDKNKNKKKNQWQPTIVKKKKKIQPEQETWLTARRRTRRKQEKEEEKTYLKKLRISQITKSEFVFKDRMNKRQETAHSPPAMGHGIVFEERPCTIDKHLSFLDFI